MKTQLDPQTKPADNYDQAVEQSKNTAKSETVEADILKNAALTVQPNKPAKKNNIDFNIKHNDDNVLLR